MPKGQQKILPGMVCFHEGSQGKLSARASVCFVAGELSLRLHSPGIFPAFLRTVFCAPNCWSQAFDGEVTLIDTAGPLKTQVWLHKTESNEVIKMELGHAYELNGVDAVAVIPYDNSALNAKTLTCNLFKEKAERVGAAMMLSP